MKQIRNIWPLLFFLVVTYYWFNEVTSANPHSAEAASLAESYTVHCKDMYLPACNIAKKCEDLEVWDVLTFIRLTAVPSLLSGDQVTTCIPVDDDHSFIHLAPVTKRDMQFFSKMIPKSNLDSVAFYLADLRLLAFRRDVELSPFAKGVILLHEGRHALNHFDKLPSSLPGKVIEDEVVVRKFDQRILRKIGGKAYQDLVEQKIHILIVKYQIEQFRIGEVFFPFGEYEFEMDSIFGPALSDVERSIRVTWVNTDVYFQLFDRYCPPELASKLKKHFVEKILN